MTAAETYCASKQAACNLQARRSADNCLPSYLYSDGVVQAVTFAYLICWWAVLCWPSYVNN